MSGRGRGSSRKNSTSRSVNGTVPPKTTRNSARAANQTACVKCDITLKDDDECIMCDKCKKWICTDCANIPDEIFSYISDHPELAWYCSKECQETVLKLINVDHDIEQRCNAYLEKVESRISDLELKVADKADKTAVDTLGATNSEIQEILQAHTVDIKQLDKKLI